MARFIITVFLLSFLGIANAARVSDGSTTITNFRSLLFNGATITGSNSDGNAVINLDTVITDHEDLTNIGVNTHDQIDSHISNGNIHYRMSDIVITESQISDLSHTVDTTLTQEQVEDFVAGLVTNGTNTTVTYNDGAGVLSIAATGVGGSDSFVTMNTPSGTDPVADSGTDTLNFTAGGIVTITGDSSTDTITISATEVDGSTTNELQNLFQTISTSSGTAPVADTTTDTVTFTGGGIVTVTGNSATDTITFSATEVDGSTTNEIQNLFQTFSTTSGTAPVADSATDTVTFTAGTGITVTGNSATDTITIASTVTDTTLTQEQVEDFVGSLVINGTNTTVTYNDGAGTLSIAAIGGGGGASDLNGLSDVVRANTSAYFLGQNGGISVTSANNLTCLGYQACKSATSLNESVAIGAGALQNATTSGSQYNTAVGYLALNSIVGSGGGNTAVGKDSGRANTSGTFNTYLGLQAGEGLTNATGNVAVGANSLIALSSGTSSYNTCVGSASCGSLSSASANNVMIGYQAGVVTDSSNNILIGYLSADNLTSGGNNIIIGHNIDAPSSSGSNQLVIGTNIYGNTSTGNVGIGANVTTEKLNIEGAIALDEITAPSLTSGYGKLYVKSSDSLLYFKDDGGTEYNLTSGGGSPGGSDTQVQFNNSGSFAGDANFTFDSTNDRLRANSFNIDGTTCLDVSSDEIYHDTNCNGSKDSGEEFIDITNYTTPTDIEITNSANGLILTAPNSTRWRLTVDNNGTLMTESL